MPKEKKVDYKKYSQHMMGQFKQKSKKAQALFIGRAIQQLTDCAEKIEEEKKLRMDTLRFFVEKMPAQTEDGEEVPGWIILLVGYEVGSYDPYTEEDAKRDEQRLREAVERRKQEEMEQGEAAMKALEEWMHPPRVEDRIQ